MAFRRDTQALPAPTRTDSGMLISDAHLTRVGVFLYRRADGSVQRELRLPEEVFHADSLASFQLVPVTLNHPPQGVTAENVREHSVGSVGDTVRQDGDHVLAKLSVQDAAAVAAVESGSNRELSCGYTCDVEMTSGTWRGQPYDAIQRNIRGNHVALVERGRAGPTAAIPRFDSDDAVLDETANDPTPPDTVSAAPRSDMETITINGVTYEVSAQVKQAWHADSARRDEALAQAKTARDAATAERDKAQARADQLDESLKAEKKARTDAAGPEAIEAAVQERIRLRDVAKKAGVEVKADMDDAAIKLAVIKAKSNADLEGRSADYVTARFDAIADQLADAPHAGLGDLNTTAAKPAARADAEQSLATAKAEMEAAVANAWKPAK